MNLQNAFKPKANPQEVLAKLQSLQTPAKSKKDKLINIDETAAKLINDSFGRSLSKKGIDAMYLMAAITEGMLGYFKDYKAEVEKIELDYDAITAPFRLHPKENRKLHDAMLKWHKRLLSNFANFQDTNEQMVRMCNRADKVQQERLNEIEEEVYDSLVIKYNTKGTRLDTYLQPGTTVEAYWLSCEGIGEQLAQLSKGLLYLTPPKLRTLLTEANFKSKQVQQGKSKITMFYVELVK